MTTATSITVRVALAIRHRPGRKTVVTLMNNGVVPVTTRVDPALVEALARAFRYQRILNERVYGPVTEIPAAEKIDRGYLGRLLQLTLMSPAIVGTILDGRQADRLTLSRLMDPVPTTWAEQRGALGSRSSLCAAGDHA